MKKTLIILMTLAILLVSGCGSDNKPQSEEKEDTRFVPWSKANLSDHVMEWNDENLERIMRVQTHISEGDIMLSDVWELTSIFMDGTHYDSSVGYDNPIGDYPVIKDLSALAELTNLSALSFDNIKISDYSPLSKLPNLRGFSSLSSCTDISALKSIESLTQITRLNISEPMYDYDSVSISLNKLSSLVSLKIYLDKNMSLDSFTGLNKLNSLEIQYSSYDFNKKTEAKIFNAIKDMKGLEVLDFRTKYIYDFKQFSKLSQLKGLCVNLSDYGDSKEGFSDFCDALSKLPHLDTLTLKNGRIVDITPVSKLTNLTYLSIMYNPLSDITPLTKLTKLSGLELSDNQIEDISSLSKLKSLAYLNLNENKIVDVTPISKLTNLKQLILSANNITDVSSLVSLSKLEYLDLQYNDITDKSVFEKFPDSVRVSY